VGARIRAGREMRGWSRRRLAEELGMSEQQIMKWEGGLNRVYVSRLWAIAKALGMPLSWFAEGFMPASIAAAHASAALGSTPEHLTKMLTAENVAVLERFALLTPQQQRIVRQLLSELRVAAEAVEQ
jgi:transcriptional regulator with XRE-family HTH domain